MDITYLGKRSEPGVLYFTFNITTEGTCCKYFIVEIACKSSNSSNDSHENILSSITFFGGCTGNLEAVKRCIMYMPIQRIIDKFMGIKCGKKNTSCMDQLARGLDKVAVFLKKPELLK